RQRGECNAAVAEAAQIVVRGVRMVQDYRAAEQDRDEGAVTPPGKFEIGNLQEALRRTQAEYRNPHAAAADQLSMREEQPLGLAGRPGRMNHRRRQVAIERQIT